VDAERLLRTLADGEYHASDEIARAFRESGAAARFAEWGLHVNGFDELGLRLERPIDLIEAESLEALLPEHVRIMLNRLELFTEIDSTNRHLLDGPAPPAGKLALCLAEYQHAGRGRRGRRWRAPLGAAVCLSASWRIGDRAALGGLSLAVGLAARRAIARVSGAEVQLKWPNDLVWDDRKLGGVLLETAARGKVRHLVMGVGINVSLPPEWLADVSDWRTGAVDLAAVTAGRPPAREALAAALIAELAAVCQDYERKGFAPYLAEWRRADCLEGRRVRVDAGEPLEGTASGVDADGALLVETGGGERHRVVSGEVTVRALP
jgi:BirA family transcriptional regulator, biotin operon repressor / biotin---[acetyl-CoA-carboxylase] ligase